MHRCIRVIMLAGMSLSLPPSIALATPITWEFDGRVSFVENGSPAAGPPLDQTVHLGDPISFIVTFDSEAVNRCNPGLWARYRSALS